MFKVICIDDIFISRLRKEKIKISPLIGEIVTVIEIAENGYYYLEEYPFNDYGQVCRWNYKKFIPISNIDETELIKERELLTEKL